MIETVPAQLRYVCTLAFGARLHTRSLDRLVTALLDAREEFGAVGRDAAEALRGPELDETTRREVQLRRFRKQAQLAARTPYYGRLFAEVGFEPRRATWTDLQELPTTPKGALKADPDAFVPAGARPAFRALTTGTTGIPTTVYFSRAEFDATVALGAISVLLGRQTEPGDVVQLSVSSRALFPVMLAAQIAARVGAVVYQAGFVDPAHALALLAERRSLRGTRHRRTSSPPCRRTSGASSSAAPSSATGRGTSAWSGSCSEARSRRRGSATARRASSARWRSSSRTRRRRSSGPER